MPWWIGNRRFILIKKDLRLRYAANPFYNLRFNESKKLTDLAPAHEIWPVRMGDAAGSKDTFISEVTVRVSSWKWQIMV